MFTIQLTLVKERNYIRATHTNKAIHFKSDICGSHCGILVPPSGPVDVY
jgi:hypothetical protein